jgi:competence protein ComEC
MSRSRIFLFLCISFIAGIFLNSIISIPQLALLGFFIFGIFFVSVLWRYKKIAVFGFCVLFLSLGILRHQLAKEEVLKSELQIYNIVQKNIVLVGVIDEEPSVGKSSLKLVLKPENIKGKILVIAGRYPEYKYGDKLEVSGQIEIPQPLDGFDYQEYLAKDGIYGIVSFPEIKLIGGEFSNPIKQNLIFLKSGLKASVENILSPPQSGLLEALFFGDEENISDNWKEKFNLVGVRHITAVSGMNITIISFLILNFFLSLGLWRRQAIVFSIVLIVFYILMIGFSASAVRAGIMGVIFLISQYLGRASNNSQPILFAAVLMLIFNPLLLKSDMGFQLSFLAMFGLIYIQPIISDLLKKVPEFFQLKYAFCATLSAQFFTLPIIIYNFGQVSLLSPLVNILIVPILSIITILGFIFAFLGIISVFLGQMIAFPAWLLLSYILSVIDFFSGFTFASLSFQISWPWLLLSYLALGLISWKFNKRLRLPSFL